MDWVSVDHRYATIEQDNGCISLLCIAELGLQHIRPAATGLI